MHLIAGLAGRHFRRIIVQGQQEGQRCAADLERTDPPSFQEKLLKRAGLGLVQRVLWHVLDLAPQSILVCIPIRLPIEVLHPIGVVTEELMHENPPVRAERACILVPSTFTWGCTSTP